jgi:hypothetical protein
MASTAGSLSTSIARAGDFEPTKLLAVFVVDTKEMELVIPFGN